MSQHSTNDFPNKPHERPPARKNLGGRVMGHPVGCTIMPNTWKLYRKLYFQTVYLTGKLTRAQVDSGKVTVLSAASGDQISSTYQEKGHGLFTYFLLKGIRNGDVTSQDGSIRIDDLYSYMKPQIERIARKQYNNEQTPQLVAPDRRTK